MESRDVLDINPDPVARDTANFPSHFLDPEVKRAKNWCMEYTRAFHNETNNLPTQAHLFRNNRHYGRYRQYARGEQDPHQYKELLGLKKNQGKINTSYRNLDFSIYKVAPKMKNVVIDSLLARELKINVRVIDPQSLNERRSEKNKMLEFVINQEQIKQFERLTQLGLDKPQQPGVPPPQSVGEIDPYLDMHPKNMMAMEVKDYLTLNLSLNNWPELDREICGHLFDVGVAAVLPYIDSNGMIKLRCGIPERMKVNPCIYPDFRDMIRVGEYHEITISDLKQKTQGSLGEETYFQIAKSVAGKNRTNSYPNSLSSYWNDSSYTYAYDHEKVTIFEARWYSNDRETYKEEENHYGNDRFRKEKWNYVPYKGDPKVNEGKGMTDDEYSQINGGKKTIYRKDIKNVYCCSWVVDTNVCYDYGLMTNMARAASSFCDTQIPWVIYTTDFMSTVGNTEALWDQFQMNWLQFQSHVAASKPDGIAIEKRSLAKLGMTGQAGEKWDPKESLLMYAEIGSYVFDGYDTDGKPLPWLPIKELKNGLSESAFQHLNIMITLLDQIRTILGINSLTEGQAPPERLGKKVAEMSFGATSNALGYLTNARKSIFERTCKMITLLLPDAMEYGQTESFSEALGLESFRFFNLNKDIGLREMGITLEEGPDDALKERIAGLVQAGIDSKQLPPEDGIFILMEENPYRQILMLRKNRIQSEAADHQRQMELVQKQGEGTMQATQAAAKQKQDELQAAAMSKQQELGMQAQINDRAKQQDFIHAVILKKLEHGMKMNEAEQKVIDDVIRIHAKGQIDVEIANIGAEAKENAPVAAK